MREAVRLAEAAAAALPELDPAAIEWFAEGMSHEDDPTPPLAGQKPTPRGHDDCLHDKAVVFTGHLPSLRREEAKALVCRHGGRVTTSVSGKTALLVVGQFASRKKFNQAQEAAQKAAEKAAEKASKAAGKKGGGDDKAAPPPLKIVDEDGLFAIIRATAHLVEGGADGAAAAADGAGTQQQQQQPPAAATAAAPAGAASGRAAAAAAAAAPAPLRAGAFHSAPAPAATAPASASGAAASGAAAASGVPAGPVESQLWVDKYKPACADDLVGNQALVHTLRVWLRQWEDVHLRGAAPFQPPGAGGAKRDMTKKAVLMTGPPGIGKTSAAHIIARELGWRVFEVNASDARNKADAKTGAGIGGKTANRVREMVTSTSLFGVGGPRVKQLLVMDEVDGMSGALLVVVERLFVECVAFFVLVRRAPCLRSLGPSLSHQIPLSSYPHLNQNRNSRRPRRRRRPNPDDQGLQGARRVHRERQVQPEAQEPAQPLPRARLPVRRARPRGGAEAERRVAVRALNQNNPRQTKTTTTTNHTKPTRFEPRRQTPKNNNNHTTAARPPTRSRAA